MKTKIKPTTIRQDSRGDHLRKLANRYLQAHGYEPVDLDVLFQWAERTNQWEPPKAMSRRRIFKAEMRRALRDDYYEDPQGRRVRKKHVIVFKSYPSGELTPFSP